MHARKASTETAIKFFTELFATPPAPITVKQVTNEQAQTDLNGKIQTISY
ncbi:NMCC_0638 family (lipo)protein [Pseudomonas neuropathica]